MRTGDNILRMMRMMVIAAFLAAAASCVKVEVNPVKQKDGRNISYDAVIAKNSVGTKAPLTSVSYPTDVPFRSIAYYNPANDDRRSTAGKNPDGPWIEESRISYDASSRRWKAEKDHLWPVDGGYLTFLSYSPSNDGVDKAVDISYDKGISAGKWDVGQHLTVVDAGEKPGSLGGGNFLDVEQVEGAQYGVDFMIADLKTNMTANGFNAGYSGVPTMFNHMLSLITFSGKVEGNVSVKVKRIILTEVYTTASFSSEIYDKTDENGVSLPDTWGELNINSPWTSHSDWEPVLIYKDESGLEMKQNEYQQIGISYIALPQPIGPIKDHNLQSIMIVVDYVTTTPGQDPTTTTDVIRLDNQFHGTEDATWERGKRYHYKLSFGEHKIIKFEGDSDAWIETEGGY